LFSWRLNFLVVFIGFDVVKVRLPEWGLQGQNSLIVPRIFTCCHLGGQPGFKMIAVIRMK
jgi:hypothetical protein